MQVILLEKVVNLGNLGEVVRVRDGYARNLQRSANDCRVVVLERTSRLGQSRSEAEVHGPSVIKQYR